MKLSAGLEKALVETLLATTAEERAKVPTEVPKLPWNAKQLKFAYQLRSDNAYAAIGYLAAIAGDPDPDFDKYYRIVRQETDDDKTAKLDWAPLCVVIVEAGSVSGFRGKGAFIVVHTIKGTILTADGSVDTSIQRGDKIRLANDAEVKICVASLTEAQMKSVITKPAFQPVRDQVLMEWDTDEEEAPMEVWRRRDQKLPETMVDGDLYTFDQELALFDTTDRNVDDAAVQAGWSHYIGPGTENLASHPNIRAYTLHGA